MFSILIPCRNYDCHALIDSLAAEARRLRAETADAEVPFDYELLLHDDASTDNDAMARNVAALSRAQGRLLTIDAPSPIGASQARQRLIRAARFPYLLFIDCDAAVTTDDFLHRYWEERDAAEVICGAIDNPPPPAPVGHELRYRYEQAAMHGPRRMEWRRAHPYEHFTVFNVLIHATVFTRVNFDARIDRYGYEDTLLGWELQREGISILHTDNALRHCGIDSNLSFLTKTETALSVLRRLGSPFTDHSPIARLVGAVRRLPLAGHLLNVLFRLLRPLLRRQLLSHHPSLLVFNLYKVGWYNQLIETT
jgi:glycosyltransferase involved in cell wall biosynthesis